LKTENLKEILEQVRGKVTPSPRERKRVEGLAEKLRKRLEAELSRRRLPGEVRLEGSIAKDTWLSGDADIDLFVLVPEKVPRKRFHDDYLKAFRKVLEGYRVVGRFAEHPYLEAWVTSKLRVNIVPCYKVKPPNWKSATDRTPYHTEYVKARLSAESRSEVRLLKRFMKGVAVYGSDIKTGGFSGYLTELLILAYGSFLEVLREASRWRPGVLIDLEGFYEGRREEAEKLFEEHCLMVVDPVDKTRNVASPLRREVFDLFRAAARRFLDKPDLRFFYPPAVRRPPPEKLKRLLKARGTNLVFVKFGRVKAVPDILWGQLYKTERALKNLMEIHGFQVLRSKVWSDEEKASIIVFELEQARIGRVKKHLGPPLTSSQEARFLVKHLKAEETVAGPYLEDGRWAVLTCRKYFDVRRLLLEQLARGGREVGVASRIADSIKAYGFQVKVDTEILSFYRRKRDFQAFLAEFLSGKPFWLSLE